MPGDPGKLGRLVYVFTVKLEECVNVNCYFVVVPAVSVETRIMCMYVYYTLVLVPGVAVAH
jgi:hypothetical protein